MKTRKRAPAPKPSNLPQPPDAKQRIVQCATRMFCERGFESTAVREIVEAAGVSKPVLYYYFRNKDDLLVSILTQYMDAYCWAIGRIALNEHLELRTSLRAIVELHFEQAEREPELVRFINSLAFSGRYDHLFDFRTRFGQTMDEISQVFRRAQQQQLLRRDIDAQSMAAQFIGMITMSLNAIIYAPENVQFRPSSEPILQILFEGIVAPAGAGVVAK